MISDAQLPGLSSPAGASGKVLLICPKFFSYHHLMIEAMAKLGFDAVWWNDRPSASAAYKAALRLFPHLVGTLSRRYFSRLAAGLAPDSIDHVLVVKGEALTPGAVNDLRRRFPRARFSLYLWDAVANTKNAGRIAPLFDVVATFDPEDAVTRHWPYRPLFATVPPAAPEQSSIVYDWSFVGTLHSDRFEVINRVERALGPAHPGYVFGFFSSPVLYALKWLRSADFRQSPQTRYALRPLSPAQIGAVMEQSRCSLDVEHPRQTGLTTRCYDALFAGRKLITTNRFIARSALYHPSRVCVIDRHAPIIPEHFLTSPFEPLPQPVIAAYSSQSWVRHVLGLDAGEAPAQY